MKTKHFPKILSLLFVSVALLSFSNCDKILEAFDIESPFSTVFPINVEPTDELIFMETKTIDISNNSDFENNKDKIDKFTIKRVYYKVISYEGDAAILGSGTFTFKDEDTQIGDAIVQNNINFQSLLDSGEQVDLNITDNTKNALSGLIKQKMKFSIKMEGLISDKPAYIDVEIFVVISASVKP